MTQFVFKELCLIDTRLAEQNHERGKTNKLTSTLLATKTVQERKQRILQGPSETETMLQMFLLSSAVLSLKVIYNFRPDLHEVRKEFRVPAKRFAF